MLIVGEEVDTGGLFGWGGDRGDCNVGGDDECGTGDELEITNLGAVCGIVVGGSD